LKSEEKNLRHRFSIIENRVFRDLYGSQKRWAHTSSERGRGSSIDEEEYKRGGSSVRALKGM